MKGRLVLSILHITTRDNDVKEVTEGFECGIAIESYRDVKEGDQLEAFRLEEEVAEL